MERTLRWLIATVASLLAFGASAAALLLFTRLSGPPVVAFASAASVAVGALTGYWAGQPITGPASPPLPRLRGRVLPTVDAVAEGVLDGSRHDRLGIQSAIPLPAATRHNRGLHKGLSSVLPAYVERDEDPALLAYLEHSAATGGFALLIGPSAAGKTRTAFEAITAVLGDWRLVRPASGAQLNQFAQAGALPRRSVVWLDDIQTYVGTDAPVTADSITRLLMPGAGPRLVIGTIWPEHYAGLLAPPAPGAPDLSRNAREVLQLVGAETRLKAEFSPAETARAASSVDPRVQEARVVALGGRVPGSLAAVPQLIKKWRTGTNPYGVAVLTAAITARRCGHPEPIPAGVLETVATTMLSEAERADVSADWFTYALTWASAPVRGQTSALSAGDDGYRVADPLIQNAADDSSVPSGLIRDAVWGSLIEAADPSACPQIGDAARRLYRPAIAVKAYRKAAEGGHTNRVAYLGYLLSQSGHDDEAQLWLRRGADAGSGSAMAYLGGLLMKLGQHDEAETWLRRAADAGDETGIANLDALLRLTGRWDETVRRRDDADPVDAAGELGLAGPAAEAESSLREAAQAGDPIGMAALGRLLMNSGRGGEAERWLRRAATTGLPLALINLGALLTLTGRSTEAEPWLRRAADTGDPEGMTALGFLLSQTGRIEEAESWLRLAAERGDPSAMANLGYLLIQTGHRAEAELWLRRSAGAGNPVGMANLGGLLALTGRPAEAERWLRRSAAAANSVGMAILGWFLVEAGRGAQAEPWLRRSAQAGEPGGMANLGAWLAAEGRVGEAELWLRRSADNGSPAGMAGLGRFLMTVDRLREAEVWLRRAADLGEPAAFFYLGTLLEQRGEIVNAVAWYQRAADTGDEEAAAALRRVTALGRTDPEPVS